MKVLRHKYQKFLNLQIYFLLLQRRDYTLLKVQLEIYCRKESYRPKFKVNLQLFLFFVSAFLQLTTYAFFLQVCKPQLIPCPSYIHKGHQVLHLISILLIFQAKKQSRDYLLLSLEFERQLLALRKVQLVLHSSLPASDQLGQL